MLTLLELSEQLGDAALSCKYDGPQRKILRKSLLREHGGKIVSEAVVDNDALLEVYECGLILYESDAHDTIFEFKNVLSDYRYDSVLPSVACGNVIPISAFYDMPWVFRVLIEAEDRVVHNMSTSPTNEGCVSLDSIIWSLMSNGEHAYDILDVIILNEMIQILKKSERSLTDYQRELIKSFFEDGRSARQLAMDKDKSRQAIEDTIKRGLINIRKEFKQKGFEIDPSLLKYK